LLDIGMGVLMIPITMSLAAYSMARRSKKPTPPPVGLPRLHNRTYGACMQTRLSDKSI